MNDQQQYEMKAMQAGEQQQYPPGYGPAPPPEYGGPPGPHQPLYPQTQTVVVAPQQVGMTRQGEQVEDNMIIAIISIFFCCILGLIATFKANSAKNLKDQPGGLEQAKRDSNAAKKLAIAAIVTGCVLIFISIFVTFILPVIIGGVVVASH